MALSKLTDKECKAATCPPDKARLRLADGGGLYLQIDKSNTAKKWRYKYRFDAKEKVMALGVYPEVSLAQARSKHTEAKNLLKKGTDPMAVRKQEKNSKPAPDNLTFQKAALDWHNTKRAGWSDEHAKRTLQQLERDLFPELGHRPIKTITGKEVLEVLQKVEARGAIETADRGLMICRQVWRYLALEGVPDVTVGIKEKLQPYRGKNFAAIIDPAQLGELLTAMQHYKGGIVVRTALLLAPILFQRPANLRTMEWAHIDFNKALWTIPSENMKRSVTEKANGEPHYVPLPKQAIELLKALQPYTGHRQYVFTGERQHTRPISDNSVRTALYAIGYGKIQTWHGFRASGRTILAEHLDINPAYLEAQLAHAVKDANGRAYNRTQYLKQRVEMMQRWADYLDLIRSNT